jgi:hypothetical protein
LKRPLALLAASALTAVGLLAPATMAEAATPKTTTAHHLLHLLTVRAESHASTYARSKFNLWVDANHDHQNTRAEVLIAESTRKVTIASTGTVKTGRWVSAYDGVVVTVASKLDIDHLVPLEQAWVSGAASWSSTRRTAYANDLSYGPTLIAVTAHANRSKGDKEPGGYLPPRASNRCTYVKQYIGVKYRWHLAVNASEKATLSADLARYCASSPTITWPARPTAAQVRALAGTSALSSSGASGSASGSGSGAGSSSVYYANCDAVRAAGKAPLYAGQPGYETPRLDRDGDGVACE